MFTLLSNKNQTITSMQDWLVYSPPAKKEAQWKDGRSAKELAKAWFRSGQAQAPAELSALLQSHPATTGMTLSVGIIEKETILDDYRGSGRMHDMVLLGSTAEERWLIAIEAKADEPFGKNIGDYLLSSVKANPNSRVPDRILQLSQAVFGSQDVTHLRYQLLHAAAGALIEANAQQANKALLIIHEFVPFTGKTSKAKQNERYLQDFVAGLSGNPQTLTAGTCLGPFQVPGGGRTPHDIPLYIGKLETVL